MELKINNKIITDIINKEVFVGKYICNGEIFYNLILNIKFKYQEENGYISMSIGKEKNNNINSFINKTYKLKQLNNILLEVYDTEKFVDTEIENDINVTTKQIINNNLQIEVLVNDKYLTLNLDDTIPIKKEYYEEKN